MSPWTEKVFPEVWSCWASLPGATTDYRLQTTDYGLRTTDYGLRITDYGLSTVRTSLNITLRARRTSPAPSPPVPSTRGGRRRTRGSSGWVDCSGAFPV